MPALLRMIVLIPLGYVAACLAAGLVMAASLNNFVDLPEPAMQGFAIVFAVLVATYAGALAAVPMLVTIVLAEAFGWRSFFFWSPFGGVLGFAGKAVRDSTATVQTPGMVALYVAAGLVAGAVYWLIAGRSSGMFAAEKAILG